jgi:hypothetical protein
MRRLAVWLTIVVLPVPLGLPATAGADVFEPIKLASEGVLSGSTQLQQADSGEDPAISADGQYVAFEGSFGGVEGIWRRDLETGAIEQVAGGDAELPSISENGEYVSFTTNEGGQLAADTNDVADPATPEEPNVYVRDMALAPSQPEAFKLVSAVNNSEEALSYETNKPTSFGAIASGRSAISASGQEVAFVTTATSNLAGPGTPPDQVAVRNVYTKETTLVSVEYDPATGQPKEEDGHDVPVSTTEASGTMYGAVYDGEPQPPRFPLPNAWVGASLSGDGTTVAWMGREIGKQAQMLADEPLLSAPNYTEPLWRRIADGPKAPTRRVTGGSDPANPACVASGETQLPPGEPLLSNPCQGPFEVRAEGTEEGVWKLGTEFDYLPRLSKNGQTVAFLASERDIASGLEFKSSETPSDLYIANMAEDLTRVQALTRLTEVAGGGGAGITRTASIADFGIAPEGNEVAFSTKRTVFPLPSFDYVSSAAGEPGMVELYDLDLADDTITRITHGFASESEPAEEPHKEAQAGQDPYQEEDEGSFSPSFSADGNTLAFSSTASNLVWGDGNGASDAFVDSRKVFSSVATEQYVSGEPPGPTVTPAWTLGATALSRSNGSVLLDVEVPGAGTLRALADSAVTVRSASAARAHHARRASAHQARVATTVAIRAVATATKATPVVGGGLVSLALTLAPSYRSLAEDRGGLSATVSITFTAPGHPAVKTSIPVTFVSSATAHAVRSSHGKAARRAAARGVEHR